LVIDNLLPILHFCPDSIDDYHFFFLSCSIISIVYAPRVVVPSTSSSLSLSLSLLFFRPCRSIESQLNKAQLSWGVHGRASSFLLVSSTFFFFRFPISPLAADCCSRSGIPLASIIANSFPFSFQFQHLSPMQTLVCAALSFCQLGPKVKANYPQAPLLPCHECFFLSPSFQKTP